MFPPMGEHALSEPSYSLRRHRLLFSAQPFSPSLCSILEKHVWEDTNQVDDAELPIALATDLDRSFERLVLCYQRQIYALGLRLTGSPEDAEEIAQDAFVRAYYALKGYPAERVQTLALRAWLYQIALNVFRNRVRGRRLAVMSLDTAAGSTALAIADDECEQPEVATEYAERRQDLGAMVAALPQRLRVAVVLRHIEGLGYRQIAALLNQPMGTVKANVHRGIGLLRAGIKR